MSRILIVEDEAHLAQGLRFNLEAEGHVVEITDRGEEALTRLLWQARGGPTSRPRELLEAFSFATCLFVALKSDFRGRRLIFRREFRNEKERRTERREGDANGKNARALPCQ